MDDIRMTFLVGSEDDLSQICQVQELGQWIIGTRVTCRHDMPVVIGFSPQYCFPMVQPDTSWLQRIWMLRTTHEPGDLVRPQEILELLRCCRPNGPVFHMPCQAQILEWFVQTCFALKHVHDRKVHMRAQPA